MIQATAILQLIILAVSGWTLREVIGLKVKVAELNQWRRDTERKK